MKIVTDAVKNASFCYVAVLMSNWVTVKLNLRSLKGRSHRRRVSKARWCNAEMINVPLGGGDKYGIRFDGTVYSYISKTSSVAFHFDKLKFPSHLQNIKQNHSLLYSEFFCRKFY